MNDITIYFRGISEYYYFAIPLVLGLAATSWLMFFSDLHIFRRKLINEKRRAERVAAEPLPKEKIEITFSDSKDAAIKVVAADLDGENAWITFQNFGSTRQTWIDYSWRQISPDGTIINSCWGNASPSTLDGGQKAEMKITVYHDDPRTSKFDVRMAR